MSPAPHDASPVYEVAVAPTGKRWKSGERPAFYDAIALLSTSDLVQAWDRCAKVTDVAMRAKRWAELRDMPGDWIRILDGDAIAVLPVDAYDAALVAACEDKDWTRSQRVLGRVLAQNALGYSLLVWRFRELLVAGTLEGRGDEDEHGLPAEVRPAAGD